MKLLIKTLLLAAFLGSILGCYKDKDPINALENIRPFSLNNTKEDSIEAKKFALWLSGDLMVSNSLVSELLFSLGYLRYKHGERIPFIKETRFKPPWVVTNLIAQFYDSAGSKIKNNEYDGWNVLDGKFHPDSIRILVPHMNIFLLVFDEMYHPQRLTELYKILPGIKFVQPNHHIFLRHETYPIFPRLNNGNLTYLFVESRDGPLHYFKYRYGVPFFIGTCSECNLYVSDPADPSWLLEARENVDQFPNWDGY